MKTSTLADAPAVRVRGLFRYHEIHGRKLPVLQDVHFEIAPRTFTAVMGPSGSGKTTLLQCISGLDRPTAGMIELGGVSIGDLGERERTLVRREKVGFVFQFFNLLPTLTVQENIELPLRIAGISVRERRAEVEALMQQFGVADRRDHLPGQLSGGEMQRTSIARALITDAPLLLCDEPTGNLATKAGEEVMRALRACCDEQKRTVLMVTHNVRDAAFADRVLILRDGQLVPDCELKGPGLTAERVHETLSRLGV